MEDRNERSSNDDLGDDGASAVKDVLVIVMVVGCFAMCVAYVGLCDRIIGPDEAGSGIDPQSDDESAEPATAEAER